MSADISLKLDVKLSWDSQSNPNVRLNPVLVLTIDVTLSPAVRLSKDAQSYSDVMLTAAIQSVPFANSDPSVRVNPDVLLGPDVKFAQLRLASTSSSCIPLTAALVLLPKEAFAAIMLPAALMLSGGCSGASKPPRPNTAVSCGEVTTPMVAGAKPDCMLRHNS